MVGPVLNKPLWDTETQAIKRHPNRTGSTPAKAAKPIFRWALFFDLIVVLGLAIFPCIYDIDGNSFGEGDQTTHAKVAQEMLHDGNKGKPYINKPPFKIWLSTIPVKLLGESTFSYRILDGIIGVLTIGSVFLFSALLFRSRLAGYLAALGLIGCRGWFFGHGFRESVQDGMMIFLVTLALFCGYIFIELAAKRSIETRAPEDSRRLMLLAALCGLLVGLGLMTKSAAALIAPIILVVWLIVSGRLITVLRNCWRELVLSATVMVLIPAMFFVPYFLARPRAMWMVFNTEVYKRATKGYHNVHHNWFYYNVIVKDQNALPPLLLAAALLIGLFFAVRKRDHRWSFLLCWSIVPVLAFSAAKSKLAWYINPAFPGMAILCGAILALAVNRAIEGKRAWTFSAGSKNAFTALCALFALAGISLLSWNAGAVAVRVAEPKKRNQTDLIVSGIQANRRAGWSPGRIVAYDYGKLNNHERLYWEMVGVEYISDPVEFAKAIDDPNLAYVITKGNQFGAIAPLRPFESYSFLKPKYVRRRWGAVIGYRDEPLPGPFRPAAWGANFANYEVQGAFGLENTSVDGNRALRRSYGFRSGIVVDGDLAAATFGLNVGVKLHGLIPAHVLVFANTKKIAEFDLPTGGYEIVRFNWPADKVERGQNLLSFEFQPATPQTNDTTDLHIAAFEAIEFALNQPDMPAAAKNSVLAFPKPSLEQDKDKDDDGENPEDYPAE
jgi:4-amino-4-deoxy-L-arabinose transferase-like glycosyltransferase